jgi:hypothetical protein
VATLPTRLVGRLGTTAQIMASAAPEPVAMTVMAAAGAAASAVAVVPAGPRLKAAVPAVAMAPIVAVVGAIAHDITAIVRLCEGPPDAGLFFKGHCPKWDLHGAGLAIVPSPVTHAPDKIGFDCILKGKSRYCLETLAAPIVLGGVAFFVIVWRAFFLYKWPQAHGWACPSSHAVIQSSIFCLAAFQLRRLLSTWR